MLQEMTVNKAARRVVAGGFSTHFTPSHLLCVNMCQRDRGQGLGRIWSRPHNTTFPISPAAPDETKHVGQRDQQS